MRKSLERNKQTKQTKNPTKLLLHTTSKSLTLKKKLDSLKLFGPTMFDFEDIFTDISEVSSKIYEIQT